MTIAVGVGNGDYYPLQTKTGSYNQTYQSGDVHIAQFDASFAIDWATYYGGTSNERLGDMVFAENSTSFFMCNSWFAGSGALWVTPPAGAYYDGVVDDSPQLISKFSAVSCDVADNTTSTATICEGDTKPLTGTPSGGNWAVVSGGGTISGLNVYTPANVASSTSVTISYTIPAAGGCPLTSDNVIFSVSAESSAPTGISGTTTICSGSSTTLTLSGGAAGAGAVAEWYTGSCGGTSVGTGNSISVSPTANTTYYVRYEGTCNTTACASQLVTVNTNSTAPTSITGTTTICSGSSTTLTLSGGSAGTGATAEWYTGSCGGTSVGTGNSISVSPIANTTYYVRYEGTCNTTTCASQLVTVNTNSVAPTSISGTTTICTGSSTTLTLAGGTSGTGATAEWFTGSCGGTAAGTGNSISVSPTVNTTYYVRYTGTCNTTTCASQLVTVSPLEDATFQLPSEHLLYYFTIRSNSNSDRSNGRNF